MTSDRETTRLVREWAREFETQLPDRVLDAVLDQLPVTPQHRRRPLASAFAGPLVPIGLAAAAALVAVLVTLNVVGTPNIGGPGPSADPSATPGVESSLLFWSGRELPAGDYVVDEPFPIRVTLTVPDGWEAFGVREGVASICNEDCELPRRAGLAIWAVENVYTEPCDTSGLADPPIGTSVDDLVTALGSLPRHQATAPVASTVGGLPATYLELEADADPGDCALAGYRAWTAGGEDVRQSPPGDRDRLWILEADGVRVMVDVAYPPDTGPEEIAELMAIVDSIRFEPGGG
ncbi:MAG: hypothetical protein M3Y40_05130 [Chloroflexota bacterium]|nr:hypothetical protein [Chloroflexota bacterium]